MVANEMLTTIGLGRVALAGSCCWIFSRVLGWQQAEALNEVSHKNISSSG